MEDTVTIDQPEVQDEQTPEQDPPKKFKVSEFAAKIKAKYPAYNNIGDSELVSRFVTKYPVYKDKVDFGVPEKKNEIAPSASPSSATPLQSPSAKSEQYLDAPWMTNANASTLKQKDAQSKDINLLGNVWNSFTSSIGGLAAGGMDIAAQILNKILPSEEGISDDQRLKKLRETVVEPTRSATTELVGAKVTPKQKEAFEKNMFAHAAGSVASMVPAMGFPKGSGFILQAYDGGLQSINNTEAGKNLPESTKTIFATGVGIATGLLMKVGVDKIFGKATDKVASGLTANVISDLVSTSKEPITTEMFNVAMQKAVGELKSKVIAAGGKIGKSAIAGGLFGSAMEATNIAAEKLTNTATGADVFEPKTWGEELGRVLHAGAEMATVGGVLGGIHVPFSKTRDYIKEKVGEAKTPEDIDALKNELIGKVNEKVGGEDAGQQVSDLVDKYVEVYSKIPPQANNKSQIVDNIQERDELTNHIAEKTQELQNVDPAFHQPIMQEINAANGRVQEINNDIARKAEEPSITVEPPQSFPEPITIGNNEGTTGEINEPLLAGQEQSKGQETETGLRSGVEPNSDSGAEATTPVLKPTTEELAQLNEAHKQLANEYLTKHKELVKQGLRGDDLDNHKELLAIKAQMNKIEDFFKNTSTENKPIQNEEAQNTELPNTKTQAGNTNEPTIEAGKNSGEGTGNGGKEPPKVEEGSGIYVEPKRTTLSFRGLQEVATEFGLEDVVPRDRKSDMRLQKDVENKTADWKEKGEYEKNVTELIERAEKGEPLSDEQRLLLQQHLSNVREQTAKVRSEHGVNSKEYDAQLKELSRLKEAGQKSRSAAGAALRIPNISSIPDNSLEGWMAERLESSGTDKLTDKQKEEIQKDHADYEKKLKDADEKLAKAHEEIANLKAETELNKEKKKSARKTDQASLKVEREDIIKSMKDRLAKSKGQLNSLVIPYADKLIAIAPDIPRLTRNLVETGVSKLADVIDGVHDIIKDYIPDVTKEDVRDLIAGHYNEKKPTKSALQRQVMDVREEAKLAKKLADLLNGEEMVKSEKKKRQQNAEITDLRKKLKSTLSFSEELEKQQKEALKAKAEQNKDITDKLNYRTPEEKTLETIIKRNESEASKIEEKIKKGEFETQKVIPFDENAALRKANPKLYKEAMDAVVAKNEAREKFDLAKRNDELAKRSKGRKLLDFGVKLISTSKAIKAGIDDSVTFVQLGMAVLANPKSGVKAKIEALKDINNTRFKRQLAALHESPYWNTIKSSELNITEPKSLTKENLEELYSGNLLDRPIKGVNLWTYTGGIFERLFTSMGNNLRLNLFMKRIEYLENQGMTFDSHPQEYKDAARVINELTGRGKMNTHVQAAMPIISPLIWAPKMLASTMNLLGISDIASIGMSQVGTKGLYRTLTPAQRTYAFTQMGKGIGMGIGIMTALSMAGWEVDKDPQSSTFGNVKNGTTSYNIFGRYAGFVKTLVQVATGTKKTSYGEVDLDADKKTGGVVGKYLRGKMTPFAGLLWDYKMNGKENTFTHEPITLQSLPNDLLTPISVNDVKKGLEQDGSISLLTRWLPAVEGMQVMDDRDFKSKLLFTKEEVDSPEFKPLKDKGVELPKMGSTKQHKIDVDDNHPNEAKEGDEPYGLMTDEEFKQFNDYRKSYFEKEVKEMLNKKWNVYVESPSGRTVSDKKVFGRDLDKKELESRIQSISSKASEEAKNKMGLTKPKNKTTVEEL